MGQGHEYAEAVGNTHRVATVTCHDSLHTCFDKVAKQ